VEKDLDKAANCRKLSVSSKLGLGKSFMTKKEEEPLDDEDDDDDDDAVGRLLTKTGVCGAKASVVVLLGAVNIKATAVAAVQAESSSVEKRRAIFLLRR
jgi:hypothetical protein